MTLLASPMIRSATSVCSGRSSGMVAVHRRLRTHVVDHSSYFHTDCNDRYQGQVNHFSRAAPEKIPYAITRFKNETLRVYGVLEIQLSGKYTGSPREYLAGKGKGKYSVADMKT